MTQKFCFKIILFLRLSLQNTFHYDQNLTGSGQYVQLSIGDIRTAAKPKNSAVVVRQQTTGNRINNEVLSV